MFSTITKLIWVVLLLPCIQSQVNEFTFSTADMLVNVTNTQEIKLTCISSPHSLFSLAKIDKANEKTITIVRNYTLLDEFSSDYKYTFTSVNASKIANVLTIKYANIYEVDQYFCFTIYGTYTINIQVSYPPPEPVCSSLQNNGKITAIMCASELGSPYVDMVIADSNGVYKPDMTGYNTTHVIQGIYVKGIRNEDVICTTTHTLIQGDVAYTTNQSCTYTHDSVLNAPKNNSSITIAKSIITLLSTILRKLI